MQLQTGLRERKKELRRQAIVSAAWELFRERGYAATTVEEIAARAGIARRTFFRYFPTKEAVVFHNSAERLALFAGLLREGGAGFPAVAHACMGMAEHYQRHRDEVVEQYRLIESSPALAVAEDEIDRQWVAAIAEALASRGTAGAKRQARIVAGAIFGAMRATLSEWLADGGRTDLARLGTKALSLFDGARA
ncbi:MAG: TetR family transcriptional regulator [Acidobacteriota bacterium]